MDEPRILDLLAELAERFGFQISYEPIRLDEELGSRPGEVCLFKGQRLVIINPQASLREKIGILSEAVRQFDLDQIYIPPVLRELLDNVPAPKPSYITDEPRTNEKPIDSEE